MELANTAAPAETMATACTQQQEGCQANRRGEHIEVGPGGRHAEAGSPTERSAGGIEKIHHIAVADRSKYKPYAPQPKGMIWQRLQQLAF